MRQKPNLRQVEAAYAKGVRSYIKKRIEMVDPFLKENFSLQGSLRRHKQAFGWDLAKAPANMLWATPLLLSKLAGWIAGKGDFKILQKEIARLPSGIRTDLEKESERLLYEELLELPWKKDQSKPPKNALFTEILNQPELSSWIEEMLSAIAKKSDSTGYREKLEKNLGDFAQAQFSAADLASNVILLATTFISTKQATGGALGSGSILAGALAQHLAIQSFWAGSTIGAVWYGWFPAQAGLGLAAVSVLTAAAFLAVLASFTGIITDPIQRLLGWHRKRLVKTIESLKENLLGAESEGFKTKASLVARLLDIIDIINTAARTG